MSNLGPHGPLVSISVSLFHRSQPVDFNLMRGAVFYIGMALWGFRKVHSLKHTPAAVLPSFLHVSLLYLLVFLVSTDII